MRNHELYKQFKQIAFDGGYTIQQVQDTTKQQVCNLLGIQITAISNDFLRNMRALLISDLQNRNAEADSQMIRVQAENFLNINFPNWEADRGQESGKRYTKIWHDGRPEEDE